MSTEKRPLRADAERNRQAIVCAAGSVLAQEGSEVTLEHIADVAGVGVGTIYRRFSSVEELMGVVLEEKMRRYAEHTEQLAQQAQMHPWEAFRDYVMFILEQQATDAAFSEVLLSTRGGTDLFHEELARAFRASVQLVDRAREAGAVRADFHHSDLLLLQHAARGLLRGTQRSAPLAWKRFGEYMLQAFREQGTGPLTPPSEIWTRTLAAEQH
ncbi:transcriptional regulator, TetR family [Promicromonospora umidemergens]|uniref:TetR/AcrR family transcriptional regulator n=1 Tax=Promicromonospora umidemergens TaxID=629679 RepID=A0ABP8Y405_9MICO|nr:TetR/AcrR family transcriptional regulator [Promicromonospora umidemergens]MCP2282753.1 transcriptional regulator, TetR family [Promicromonospora umidemergens]